MKECSWTSLQTIQWIHKTDLYISCRKYNKKDNTFSILHTFIIINKKIIVDILWFVCFLLHHLASLWR